MKSFFNLPQAALVATAPLLATAHMFLEKPTPFPGGDNSPLLGTGDNFPCRVTNPSQYTASTRNQWAVGSQQPLEFKGTAVHGGGSCQVSVTTDKAPTKASKWRVIMSIEGGCPASVEGNLKPDERLNNFTMTVPPELPDGDLTMAWTWFNHLGNREFYMVCAPITVSGGAKDTAEFDKLPEMARANVKGIGADDCIAPHGNDYLFANPGKNVVRMGLPQNKLVPLCGGKPEGGSTSPGPQPANPGAPSPAPGAPSQAPANPGVPSQAPTPSGSAPASPAPANPGAPTSPADAGGVVTSTIRTIVTITASPGTPGPSNAPSPAPPAPTPGTPASGPVAAPSQAPPAGAGSGTCSTDGAIVCNGPSQFAICNFGKAAWQPVAQGTTCQGGKIVRRHVAPVRRHGREWV